MCIRDSLGTEAYNFVNWLVSARQSLWQMLPLGDIGAGNSPYMSPSAFGGNVLLISLEKCRDAGWLKSEELIPDSAFETARVNYPAVSRYRIERLKLASKRFFDSTEKNPLKSFLDFCQTAAFWLDNYALFKSITDIYKTEESGWQTWPKPVSYTHLTGLNRCHVLNRTVADTAQEMMRRGRSASKVRITGAITRGFFLILLKPLRNPRPFDTISGI